MQNAKPLKIKLQATFISTAWSIFNRDKISIN
jgi:hypothetical protein